MIARGGLVRNEHHAGSKLRGLYVGDCEGSDEAFREEKRFLYDKITVTMVHLSDDNYRWSTQ